MVRTCWRKYCFVVVESQAGLSTYLQFDAKSFRATKSYDIDAIVWSDPLKSCVI